MRALLGVMLGALVCPAFAASAGEARAPDAASLQTIVVHGTKFPPDEELKRDVKRALHEDTFFYDEHVTVTVEKGIVHLEGIVLDPGDIRDVMRIIKKKFPGVKRVINELEVCREDSDDG
jgi:hypothetical protein